VGKTAVVFIRASLGTVHPHACGENRHPPSVTRPRLGTPPRLWGKPSNKSNIPLTISVHPHACGENNPPASVAAHGRGTPPRLWGKLNHNTVVWATSRYTPTPVGKTIAALFRLIHGAVHPHACGENVGMAASRWVSSVHPHACGENVGMAASRWVSSVHPHACGENSVGGSAGVSTSGTPPRLWGKRRQPS